MADTNIEWAEKVWNPLKGCTRVSKGCEHCYAERMAVRLQAMGKRGYEGVVDKHGRWTGRVNLVPEVLAQPLSWKKGVRIFVDSQSDLFHKNVTNEQIAAVLGVAAATPQHKHLILTKRPERALEFMEWIVSVAKSNYTDPWTECHWAALNIERATIGSDGPIHQLSGGDLDRPWPLPNVWIGVSVESDDFENRIAILRKIPAAVRFLSIEPMLGPVHEMLERQLNFNDMSDDGAKFPNGAIHWAIFGGESGAGYREMDMEWLAPAIHECDLAGVPVFVKQDSGPKPGMQGRLSAELWARKEFPNQ